mmetsp:Transcript_23147/g.33921  ORF Transcript_23147/g.33921 Transcript_23147/m.33921 type:complete len:260 (-) Transcript_23147:257-1036(-)
MNARKSVLHKSTSVQSIIPVVKQHGLEVSITGYEEADGGSYANFIIEVKKDNIIWEVRKRYSEFRFFYQAVAEHAGSLTNEFPSKSVTVGKMSAEQLERRKIALNAWFQDFLDNVAMSPGVQSQLYAFLRVHANTSDERPNRSRTIDITARIKPGTVVKTGYLEKLGGNKSGAAGNWKRRYAVLQDDIKYYENEQAFINGAAPKGVVKLNAFYVTTSDGENPHNEFTVHAMPYPLVCRAENEVEMKAWVDTLNSLADIE